jgi:hypothetical protein
MLRDSTSNVLVDYDVLGCFATIEQAKASLQYEYDLYLKEHADIDDPDDLPVWTNDDHTELKIPSTEYYNLETILYIDSTVNYQDSDEPLIQYEHK